MDKEGMRVGREVVFPSHLLRRVSPNPSDAFLFGRHEETDVLVESATSLLSKHADRGPFEVRDYFDHWQHVPLEVAVQRIEEHIETQKRNARRQDVSRAITSFSVARYAGLPLSPIEAIYMITSNQWASHGDGLVRHSHSDRGFGFFQRKGQFTFASRLVFRQLR
jgi:hypothetical protein